MEYYFNRKNIFDQNSMIVIIMKLVQVSYHIDIVTMNSSDMKTIK